MSAGGPSGYDDAARVAAKRRQVLAKKIERAMNFGDDFIERRLRGQRVANQRDIDAMRQRSRSKQCKNLLGAVLPIAAVDEHQRRPVFRDFEKIDPIALARAISEVEMVGMLRAHLS